MKRLILLILAMCLFMSCTKTVEKEIKVNAPVMGKTYVARFPASISVSREFGDKLVIQKELQGHNKAYEIYSLDIASSKLKYEFLYQPQEMLLYESQLDAETKLEVRQLGNGEENNIMVLAGKISKSIAKNIAYSGAALVLPSPNKRYILYCTPSALLNHYDLFLFDIAAAKTLLLTEAVDEELLNDFEGNIAWSPDNTHVLISNKLLFNALSGKLIYELKAHNLLWSQSGSKLAYIKEDKGLGKSICILDINAKLVEEVFIANQDEYLPGYMVWSHNEARLAFVTSIADKLKQETESGQYDAIYSLDLDKKEAVRVDTVLGMDQSVTAKLGSMQYNSFGNVLALIIVNNQDADLYAFNFNKEESTFANNIEYMHSENNEAYISSSGASLYFIQGQSVFELDENLKRRNIYKSAYILEDLYISLDGSSMIIIEASEKGIILRQLTNFIRKDI